MRFTPDNFLQLIKNLVTGHNGDDSPASGTAATNDGGIKVDQPIPLGAAVNPASLPAITDSTGGTAATTFAAISGTYATDYPRIANALSQVALELNSLHAQFGSSVSGVPAIVLAAGATAIATVSFPIPRDYDEASDHLAIRLIADLAAGDTLTTGYITGTATVLPIATGTASAKSAVKGTAPFSTATLILSTTEQVFEITLSGYGLKRDDVISVALAVVGTTTAGTQVYAIEKHYDSTIVSYNETDATDNPSTSGNTSTTVIQPGFGNPLR